MKNYFFLLTMFFSFAYAQAQTGWKFYPYEELPGSGHPTHVTASGSDLYFGFTDGLVSHGSGLDGDWHSVTLTELDTACRNPDFAVRDFRRNSAFLWIGTDHGLLQYDGTGWIRRSTCNTPTMLDERIRGIAPVDDLDLWYLSEADAISKYVYDADSVINYPLSPSTPKPFINDVMIASDYAGRAWYQAEGRLVCFDRDSARIIDSEVIPWLNNDYFVSFHMLNPKSMVVLMMKHIGILDLNGTDNKYTDITVPGNLLEPSENFTLVEADELGRIWTLSKITSSNGNYSTHFYKLTPEKKWTKYTFPMIAGVPNENFLIDGLAVDELTTAWFVLPDYGILACDYTNLSVQKEERAKFELSPNPANDYIKISNADRAGLNYSISNSLGVSIQAGIIQRNQISISSLPTGAYFLQVGCETRAFVKE